MAHEHFDDGNAVYIYKSIVNIRTVHNPNPGCNEISCGRS